MIYEFTKNINSDKLKIEIAQNGLSAPSRIDTIDSQVFIHYTNPLTEPQIQTLTTVITNHVALTTGESLSIYLQNQVFPFTNKLITDFAAENISMGITQLGKTGPVLGMFAMQIDVNNDSRPYSLKETFDTGSLYESLKVLQYIRNNPSMFTGLSPFITDARLLAMKNKIETFLGVPLST